MKGLLRNAAAAAFLATASPAAADPAPTPTEQFVPDPKLTRLVLDSDAKKPNLEKNPHLLACDGTALLVKERTSIQNRPDAKERTETIDTALAITREQFDAALAMIQRQMPLMTPCDTKVNLSCDESTGKVVGNILVDVADDKCELR